LNTRPAFEVGLLYCAELNSPDMAGAGIALEFIAISVLICTNAARTRPAGCPLGSAREISLQSFCCLLKTLLPHQGITAQYVNCCGRVRPAQCFCAIQLLQSVLVILLAKPRLRHFESPLP
jgi:hypothetical protein